MSFPPRDDRMMRADQYEVGGQAKITHSGHVRRVTAVRRVKGENGELIEHVQLDHHPTWHAVDTVRPTQEARS